MSGPWYGLVYQFSWKGSRVFKYVLGVTIMLIIHQTNHKKSLSWGIYQSRRKPEIWNYCGEWTCNAGICIDHPFMGCFPRYSIHRLKCSSCFSFGSTLWGGQHLPGPWTIMRWFPKKVGWLLQDIELCLYLILHPGNDIKDIGSGNCVVHNTFLLDHPQKSVLNVAWKFRPHPFWFYTLTNVESIMERSMRFLLCPGVFTLLALLGQICIATSWIRSASLLQFVYTFHILGAFHKHCQLYKLVIFDSSCVCVCLFPIFWA